MACSGIDVSSIPTNIPVAEYIQTYIDKYADKVCFTENGSGRKLTFDEFRSQVGKLAAHLWDRGWRTGDTVVFFAGSMIEFPMSYHAVNSIGVISHPLNPSLLKDDLIHHLIAVDAKMVFATSATMDVVQEATEIYKHTGHIIKDIIALDIVPGFTDVAGLLEMEYDPPLPRMTFDPMAHVLSIFSTSGTTGPMKFPMLSHYTFISCVEALSDFHAGTRGTIPETVLMTVPCFAGQSILLANSSLRNGWMMVLPSIFELEAFLQAIEAHQVTIMHTSPGMVNAIGKTALLEKYDLSTLREIVCLGSKISSTTIEAFQQKLPNVIFKQVYGSTEAGILCCPDPEHNNLESVGKISRFSRVKIVDIETRAEVGLNDVGEILTRGPQLFMGYKNNPEANVNSMEDCWFKTGDVGYIDENGNMYVIDRIKDIIKASAFQVSPSELETMILTHPSVVDVAVVGIPTEDETGEKPKAFVVKKQGFTLYEEDIIQYVKERLAPQKHLTGGAEFVERIPRNSTGKILRRQLREQFF